MCEKNILFTGYAQHKFGLWKSCGFDFVRFPPSADWRTSDKTRRTNTENPD